MCYAVLVYFFFFNDTATTEIYTLFLHDALPISGDGPGRRGHAHLARHRGPDLAPLRRAAVAGGEVQVLPRPGPGGQDPPCRRGVPSSSRGGGGALRRREGADPSPGGDGTPGAR